MNDLYLSPDHAVFIDDVLVPVRLLINGRTIRCTIVPAVTYYHVELPSHDVILAEGLPVESYLDTGDRTDFSVMANLPAWAWEALGPARLVMTGPALESIRRRLA